MTTAAPMPDLTGLDKAQQLHALRQRMATIPGRRDHAPGGIKMLPSVDATTTRPPTVEQAPEAATTEPAASLPQSKTLRTIPTPMPITALLPRGALARGTALTVTGAGSVLIGLIATATAAGHHVAIIGLPELSALAAYEQGADLQKVAFIDPGSGDALDSASILLDGIDIVVTTLSGRDVPPTRARALLARCRSHGSILVTTNGRMPGIDLTIDSTLVGSAGIGQGRGRLRSLTFETSVHGRGTPQRTARHTLTSEPFGPQSMYWTPAAHDSAERRDTPAALAVAQ